MHEILHMDFKNDNIWDNEECIPINKYLFAVLSTHMIKTMRSTPFFGVNAHWSSVGVFKDHGVSMEHHYQETRFQEKPCESLGSFLRYQTMCLLKQLEFWTMNCELRQAVQARINGTDYFFIPIYDTPTYHITVHSYST
jgi:hypothetical protein